MTGVVDFNMIVEINELLKSQNMEYSLHSIGGCASCGVKIRCDGQEQPLEKVIEIVNGYLSQKFLIAVQSEYDPYTLNVYSKFKK